MLFRMGQKIIILVVHTKGVGARLIRAGTVLLGMGHVPVKIAEGDLPVLGNGLLDGVYIIINGIENYNSLLSNDLSFLVCTTCPQRIQEVPSRAGWHFCDDYLAFFSALIVFFMVL